MVKISSSTGAANAAVTGIKSVAIENGQSVDLGSSNIVSMLAGAEINNQLMPDLTKLVECVTSQSDKFPKLAEAFAIKDQEVKFQGGQ